MGTSFPHFQANSIYNLDLRCPINPPDLCKILSSGVTVDKRQLKNGFLRYCQMVHTKNIDNFFWSISGGLQGGVKSLQFPMNVFQLVSAQRRKHIVAAVPEEVQLTALELFDYYIKHLWILIMQVHFAKDNFFPSTSKNRNSSEFLVQ